MARIEMSNGAMCRLDSFVAIDFETANASRVSACALGFVKVVNREIVDERFYLINPIGAYSRLNIAVHGIRPEQTENAPTFDEIYPELRCDIENLPVLCYSTFDSSVFAALAEYYHLPVEMSQGFWDVYAMAREMIGGLPNYRLPTVAYALQIPYMSHHDAKCDAMQCAKIYLRLSEQGNIGFVNEAQTYRDIRDSFVRLASDIISDGVVELDEAYQLQAFLNDVAGMGGLFEDVARLVDDILSDGVVTEQESSLLASLLGYVLGKLRNADDEVRADVSGRPCAWKRETVLPHPDFPVFVVPDCYKPVLKEVPARFKERWPYVVAHPFVTLASANVVITEEGTRISRDDAEHLVDVLGGNLKSSTTRDTDFCVVLGMPPECCKTGKVSKARILQEQGSPIRILGEDEFIELIRATLKEGTAI